MRLLLLLATVGMFDAQAQMVAVSSADYLTPVAPASLVSLFGSNLASSTASAQLDSSGRLPVTLAGVSVQVSGQAAQLLYVSPSQINLVMPASVGSGTAEIVVQPRNVTTTVEVRNTAPALFTADASGKGVGSILNGVTYALGPFSIETLQNNGDDKRTRLSLFGTGIRYAGNPFLDPSLTNAAASVQARASDASGNLYDLPVEYAGAAPIYFGLDQVNVVLPPQLDGLGALSITVTAGNVSSNVVTANISRLADSAIRLVGVSLADSTIMAGSSVTGLVTLNAPARGNGFGVSITSSNAAVQAPASVTVTSGQVSATFALQTTASAAGPATVTASANGVSRNTILTVNSTSGPSLATLTLSSSSVSGGSKVTGTVSLSAAALGGGAVLQLSSDSGVVQPPATVTIPFGRSSADFSISTSAVTTAESVSITASFNGATKSATLKVNPAFTIDLGTDTVIGGQSTTGTITLGGAAPPSGAIINLTSSDLQLVRLNPTVTIPGGGTSASFTVMTSIPPAARTVNIGATYAGITQTVPISVIPAGTATVSGLSLNPTSVKGGASTTATVTLSSRNSSPFGVTVTLQSSNKLVGQVPATITVPSGQDTANFAIATTAVAASQTITITASSGGASRTATLLVTR